MAGAFVVLGVQDSFHTSLVLDSALVAYTFASSFATFGLTYRYAMWLQRPPTGFVLAARLGSLLQTALPKSERDQLVSSELPQISR
jgi:hypothetical protein